MRQTLRLNRDVHTKMSKGSWSWRGSTLQRMTQGSRPQRELEVIDADRKPLCSVT